MSKHASPAAGVRCISAALVDGVYLSFKPNWPLRLMQQALIAIDLVVYSLARLRERVGVRVVFHSFPRWGKAGMGADLPLVQPLLCVCL